MKTAVTRLADVGFVPIREERGDAHFVDLARKNLVIRIVRDRGEHFVRVRASADDSEWYDSDVVLRALSNVVVAPMIGSSKESLDTVVPLLVQHLEQLDEAFESGRLSKTRQLLHDEELAGRRRMFGF